MWGRNWILKQGLYLEITTDISEDECYHERLFDGFSVMSSL
jgi:hypothetical protein